jgi:hypothetical protein
MSELAELFQEQETRMGVFYPTGYVVAVFRSLDQAKSAHQIVCRAGFTQADARAVPGSDVLDYFDELSAQTGIWGLVMTEFSKAIDTEASFQEKDIKVAKRGAGFLVIRSETEEEAERIRGILAGSGPLAMQWYGPGAVYSLV